MQTQTPPIIDPLQIKIEKAKAELPTATQNAIDSVDWRAFILGLREKKGYSYSQLEDLEIETELLLCGLLNPDDYPNELMKRMQLPKAQVDLLINELNESIFKKIREKLMENEGKSASSNRTSSDQSQKKPERPLEWPEVEGEGKILSGAGIEITPEEIIAPRKEENMEKPADMLAKVENPDLITPKTPQPPVTAQKLSGSFQIPTVKTEYSLPSLEKGKIIPVSSDSKPAKIGSKTDPYRLSPDE